MLSLEDNKEGSSTSIAVISISFATSIAQIELTWPEVPTQTTKDG